MRFKFGRNWQAYAKRIDEAAVETAESSMLGLTGILGSDKKSFLDVGCGSGLFSAAASRLGLSVYAFDFDPTSVATTRETMKAFARAGGPWTVEQGDILDLEYVGGLPVSDVVYSWGVLHHTGDMWRALQNTCALVAPGGLLVLAIYNDQGWKSVVWRRIKWLYVRVWPLRPLLIAGAFTRMWSRRIIADTVKRRDPMASWREYGDGGRAMSARHDLVDWVGGYPFEVASSSVLISKLADLGFELVRLVPVEAGGSGNNEFVARRVTE